MKKRLFFLGALFLSSLLVAVFVFSGQQKPLPPGPAPTYKIQEPPQGVRVPDSPTGVVFSFVGPQVSLPASLPVYRAESTLLTDAQITTLSKTLGFTVAPTIRSSGGTVRRYWNEKEKSFSFVTSPSRQSISYQKFFSPPTNNSLTTERAIESARVFLSRLSSSSVSFRGSIQTDSFFDGLVIQENPKPSLFLVNFTLLAENQYPFLVANYEPSVSSVIVDAAGVVRYLVFVFPPSLIQTKTERVLPLDVAISALNNGKGLLLSSQKEGVWGSISRFHSVQIKDVQVSYVQETGGVSVDPVYVFSGTAADESGGTLSVRYLLFASAE